MNRLIILFFTGIFASYSALASFVAGKGAYEFYIESEDVAGKDGFFRSSLEIGNEVGVSENRAIGINFYGERYNDSNFFNRAEKFTYTEVYLKSNFELNKNNFIGVRNMLRHYGGEGEYNRLYELRIMYKNTADTGFYQSFRADIAYRRKFTQMDADILKNELHFAFKINNRASFKTKIETDFAFASSSDIKIYENGGDINSYKFNGFKVYESKIYTGPEYEFKNGHFVYVQYLGHITTRAGVREKGVFVGYSTSFDLF